MGRRRGIEREWRSTLPDCRGSGDCWNPELYILRGKNEKTVEEWEFFIPIASKLVEGRRILHLVKVEQ